MGTKTRLSSYCTKRGENAVNLVTSRKTNARLARPINVPWTAGSFKVAPPLTLPCEGREARFLHPIHRESNPGSLHGSPLHNYMRFLIDSSTHYQTFYTVKFRCKLISQCLRDRQGFSL